ncbi:MAG: VCBS repeat-containing protein [Calothrix sp. CSU_2_0]|nr:VCBS repeat-containing protein [Calothrix sp. CSU_2_0]
MTIANNLNPLKTPDFNGDGKGDIFWRSDVSDQNAIWLTDGLKILQGSLLPSVRDEDGWDEIVPADFNGDNKTDLFWRNSKTGQNAIWLVDGVNLAGAAVIDSISLNYDFDIGDFNGDGKADIFWRNENTGENAIWLMNGTNRIQAEFLPSVPKEWEYVIGEFNADSKTDFFWRNKSTGQNAVWLMDGVNLAQFEFTRNQDTSWDTFQITDYDGDGRTDIFWRNSQTGKNQIWTWMESGLSPGVLNLNLPDKNSNFDYQLADFNGDSRIDFLWHNSVTGENQVWLSNGSQIQTSDLPITPKGWIPGIADTSGDGKSDIAWYNILTGETAVWLMDGSKLSQASLIVNVPISQQWQPIL